MWTKITPGRTIISWKNTPGPSVKEYDFWQHVITAMHPLATLERVGKVATGTAFHWYMVVKLDGPLGNYPGHPEIIEWRNT